jgi:hypothetical protein
MRRYVNWVNQLGGECRISQERFIECPVIHPSVAVRRSVLEALGGYREMPWAEDHDLWLRLLESGGLIGKVPGALLDWHDRSERLTRSDPRYGIDRTWRMKAHFIGRLARVRSHGIAMAGAGPIGKTLARHLSAEGALVHGFFDVHPRRIGGRAAGLPVRDSGGIGSDWREAVLISCAGVAGAREEIRTVAAAAGYREGEDFWCAC